MSSMQKNQGFKRYTFLFTLAAFLICGVVVGCAGGGTDGTGLVSIQGRYLDIDQNPISAVVTSSDGGMDVESTTTDTEGRFEINSPQDGELRFESQSQPVSEFSVTTLPQASALRVEFQRGVNNVVTATKVEVIVPSTPTPVAQATNTPIPAPTSTAPPGATASVTPTAEPTVTPTATNTPTASGPQLGDLNCDGMVNGADGNPFSLALLDPVGYAQAYPNCDRNLADINQDGAVNNFDIDPFNALIGS